LVLGIIHDRAGVSATEYGLLLAGVGLLVLVAVFAMGDTLDGLFIHVGSVLADSF
jgi:Flp pilus assembly pilin Flp